MNHILNQAAKFLKDNSHHILSVGAIIGTGATAYFSGKAAYETGREVEAEKEAAKDYLSNYALSTKDIFKKEWRRYVPAALAFTGTTICIVGSNRVSSRKIVAATMAYSLSEKAFNTYKEKVVEQLGAKKERAIVDEIAADKVRNNPPPPMIVAGSGSVLCCESHTMRYFTSDMETLMQAVNKINAQLMRDDRATLSDWYYLIGLKETHQSHDFGWESPKLLELVCTAVMADNNRPCLSFDYNYLKQL